METSSIITLLIIGIVLSKTIIGVLVWHLIKKNRLLKQDKQLLAIKNEELAKTEEYKLKVLGIAAHDLRSPFVSLRMLLEAQQSQQLSPENFEVILEELKKQVEISHRMVDDILMWTAVEIKDAQQKKQVFNLYETVNEILALFQPLIKQKNISITCDVMQNVDSNSNLEVFNFIIRNVLHNAIKYSPENEEVLLELYVQDDTAQLTIVDKGVGMNTSKLKAVNEGALISDKQKSGPGGMGLGLSLCHMLAKRADWRILAESKEGEGCKITLLFPGYYTQKKNRYS